MFDLTYFSSAAFIEKKTQNGYLWLVSIMFLDTLYSKKWYDMSHIGCGIPSLQRSTISRIGRHSVGYNIGMRVVLYKL